MVNEKYPELRLLVIIDPSYDDATKIIVIAKNSCGCDAISVLIVALNEPWKAWHVQFDYADNSERVYADLEEINNRTDGLVRRAMARPYVIVQLEGGVLADTWIILNEKEAVVLAGKIAGDRCRDDDVLVELPSGMDIHAHSTRIWFWSGGEGD